MNLESIINQLIPIVREAGAFLLKERVCFDQNKIETKDHDSNLVSYVDRETEKFLVEKLKHILPTAGFITEEGTVEQSTQSLNWLIDPLDGTNNYLHNIPLYSTSIGLVLNNQPIAGIIHDPNRAETFYAWQGGGAWLNGARIHCAPIPQLNKGMLATGFPYYMFDKFDAYMSILKDLMKQSHGLRRCGSAAIDLAWVACGRFDAYFEYNIQPYDIAAGCILVSEAGGKICDFYGEDQYLTRKHVIASTGAIHKDLKNIISNHWK